MNYLGHAYVALTRSREPRFVLGSMLPDFATMARARLAPEQPDGHVQRGVSLHHVTDDAFHGHPRFLQLVDRVTRELSERGVKRGAARAVGHIGVELLLDGELLDDLPLQRAYTDALNAASAVNVRFRGETGDGSDARFVVLSQRLREFGVPWDYRRPEGVTLRLMRALSARPRLRPEPEDAEAMQTVLGDVQPAVREATAPILEAVLEACEASRDPA